MTLNSIYSLTWACHRRRRPQPNSSLSSLSQHLPDNFVAGFVHNHPALRFITCQTRKYQAKNSDDVDDDDIEVWTVLSSPTFAKKHKAPQEFLPEETIETVSKLLLSAVQEAVTGQPVGDKEDDDWKKDVLDSRLQLWGAAVPVNVWCSSSSESSSGDGGDDMDEKDLAPAGFLYDAQHAVGACGDWLQEPSIAGAWTSGRRLAEHMLHDASSSHGLLSGSFQKSESTAQAGIGALSTATTTTTTTTTTATRRTAKKKKKKKAVEAK